MAECGGLYQDTPEQEKGPFFSFLISVKCSKEKQSHSEAKAEEQSRNHTDPRFVKEQHFAQPLPAQVQERGRSMGWPPPPRAPTVAGPG